MRIPLLISVFLAGTISAQETYWGMTSNGGQNNAGTIYTMTSTGTFTKKYDFQLNEGTSLRSELVKATNGLYYGVTFGGGNLGNGTLFSLDPVTGVYSVLHNFSTANGTQPERGLIQASDGHLYGVCRAGGTNSAGTLFQFNISTNTFTKKHNFTTGVSGTGQTPRGRLLESGGKLWGVTQSGGANSLGTIYEYDIAGGTVVRRFSMTAAQGSGATTGMILGSNGLLYGTTFAGGVNSLGAMYSFNTGTFAYTLLYSFAAGGTGNKPFAELVEASPGLLFGTTTLGGGNNLGNIFDYDLNTSTYTPRLSFSTTNGHTCFGRLTQASNGLLYGMTSAGGTSDAGTMFSWNRTTSTFTLLANLNSVGLGTPFAGLLEDPTGSLNATCSAAGSFGLGAIFRYNIAGATFSVLAHMGSSTGAYPWGRLTRASSGIYYGTTSGGGANNAGVIFSFDPTGNVYTKLVDMSATNGKFPYGRMAIVGNVLYGMCGKGGTNDLGTLFSYDISTSIYTVKQNLTTTTGGNPQGGLMLASDGKLYGTCSENGTNGFGTIFSYTIATNTLNVLRQLSPPDGTVPMADMMQASDGFLYGTLSEGGTFGGGAIYRITPATGVFTRVADLEVGVGTAPAGELAEISGTLYSTTSEGGANLNGTVFRFVISTASLTNLYDLATSDGTASMAGLLAGSDGKLYGTCSSGGAASLYGTVFRYDPVADVVNVLRTLGNTDGVYPRDGLIKETLPAAPGLALNAKVFLEGPYVQASNLMRDSLRVLGYVPLAEPYTGLGFAQVGGGGETTTAPVLAVTGNNAIVDWIRVELRSSGDPTSVVATKQCLLQRDGDIVGTDGVSAVSFTLSAGNYYVALRHRNHLSVMTAAAVALSSSPTTVDFTLPATSTYGTNAQKTVGTAQVLWAGNVLRDSPAPFLLKYTGSFNDRDPILLAIGGVVPTNTVTGYSSTDVNMDGTTKYTGIANDRDVILLNIGGVVPTNTRTDQLP